MSIPEPRPAPGTNNPVLRWLPLAWAGIALVIHTLFVALAVPRLPESILIWLSVDAASMGDHYYRFATHDIVVVGFVAIGVIAAAGLVGVIVDMLGVAWCLGIGLIVAPVVGLFAVLVYTSTLWQIGMTEPADTMSSGTGFLIMLLAAGGAALGVASFFWTAMLQRKWVARVQPA